MTNDNLSNLRVTPTAVTAGLLTEKDGEPHLTDAGLFAMVGMMAHDDEADSQVHCQDAFHRILTIARAGGLDTQEARVIQWAFTEGINPAEGSEDGTALATLCGRVARCVGAGRMAHICENKKPN